MSPAPARKGGEHVGGVQDIVDRPATQVAIHIARAGGPEVLEPREVAVPVPAEGEVLIEVHAAGVNRHDCNQRRRGPTPLHSDVPGLEVSGVIVAIGPGVPPERLGTAVCALTDGGGYAHYAIAQSAQALPVPAGMDWRAAAAVPEAAFTVWHNFFRVAALQPGEPVLIHGGTSGVGTFAIQVLTALGHAVHVTCGTAAKRAAARALGAVTAQDYGDAGWVGAVRASTGGRGIGVILDMSAGAHVEQDVEVLAPRGRIVHLSPGSGVLAGLPLRTVMAKSLSITGSLLRPLPDAEKVEIASALSTHVWPLITAGRVAPVVHGAWPLAEAADAHRAMEAGQHIGKLVLDVPAARVDAAVA